MAKYYNQTLDVIFSLVANKRHYRLTPNEYSVFLLWITDAPSFDACPRILSERSGIQLSNVKRALRGLVTKKVLKKNGFKGLVTKYRLTDEFQELANEKVASGEILYRFNSRHEPGSFLKKTQV